MLNEGAVDGESDSLGVEFEKLSVWVSAMMATTSAAAARTAAINAVQENRGRRGTGGGGGHGCVIPIPPLCCGSITPA
ncbi:hypothetical protein HMPREF0591_4375 [Mycobacterium parascrofulaceum ATCC BAA-614]|uniref:Uncharacterized protein n=1 Tax=Mycobacterium parascrofulaceum ATCC BAA-614 TaxID=525368 RepID=D5PDY1_9MYCO|nr:hypothetical protein HMPREF0591_4375 [Mycobacterium parascrofulaceum ATCC BAA-614]